MKTINTRKIKATLRKYLELISYGPTIKFPHSPDEKVNIASVGHFWDLLVDVLKNIPEKP